MKNKPSLKEKHGSDTWINDYMDELRRTECLCLHCGLLQVCSTARGLFEICVNKNIAMAITRCSEWEEKQILIVDSLISIDFDGVLCLDPLRSEINDEEKYLKFLKEAPKLHLHIVERSEIEEIITGRYERHRGLTEEWLRKYNIKYKKMIMCPDDVIRNRQSIGEHKAKWFVSSKATTFIESNPIEAQIIKELTNKKVICTYGGHGGFGVIDYI